VRSAQKPTGNMLNLPPVAAKKTKNKETEKKREAEEPVSNTVRERQSGG